MRVMAASSSNRKAARALVSSVLPTPVGPRNRKEPSGRLGSFRPARARRTASDDGLQRLVLADDAAAQGVLHRQQFLALALQHLVDRDAGPAGDDGGDLFGVDDLGRQGAGLVGLVRPRPRPAVSRCRGSGRRRSRTRGRGRRCAGPAASSARRRSRVSRSWAPWPTLSFSAFQRAVRSSDWASRSAISSSSFSSRATGGLVGLLLQGLALDLELDQAAVDLVQALGLGIDGHAHAAAGLVDQVDGLVGQEAVGDVAVATGWRRRRWRCRRCARRGGPRTSP